MIDFNKSQLGPGGSSLDFAHSFAAQSALATSRSLPRDTRRAYLLMQAYRNVMTRGQQALLCYRDGAF
jgi:hypothetical protein